MLLKTVFREIRHSLGRYLAIFAIVALGVGFFNGLWVTKSAMIKTLDDYVTESSMFDYELISTLGFTDDDVTEVSELSGVKKAAGSYSNDLIYVNRSGGDSVLKAYSLTDGINEPKLMSGSMPQNDNECLADAKCFSEDDIGTYIDLSDSNSSDTMDSFTCDEYLIVGIMETPLYINFERGSTSLANGVVSGYIFLMPSGFDMDAYSEVYVTLNDEGYAYSDEYDDNIDSMKDPLEELTEKLASDRYDGIISDGQKEINDAKDELASGQEEYDTNKKDGEQKISDAEDTLSSSRKELDDGWNAYREGLVSADDGEEQLDSAKEQLDSALVELNNAESEYSTNKAKLDDAYTEYNGALSDYESGISALGTLKIQYESDKKEYDDYAAANSGSTDINIQQNIEMMKAKVSAEEAMIETNTEKLSSAKYQLDATVSELSSQSAALSEGRDELDEKWNSYYDSLDEYNDQKSSLENARATLEDTYSELTEAEAEYSSGVEELEDSKETLQSSLSDAEEKLSDASSQISDAEEKLAEVKEPSVYTLDRYTNVGYSSYESDSEIVEHIAYVFPIFFFLVAALVCITTMTRMVDDQRTQIGTLKALGFGDGYIISKYLVYSGSAALLGCAVGYFGGSYMMPKLIWQAYNIMYGFGDIAFVLDEKMGVLSVALFFLCAMLATWQACRNDLRSAPAELIRPKSPKAGKRIFLEKIPFIWKHLSFLLKVSLRNMFRYKKRLWMMIVGIGGCTALLLTGFGINDSISHVVDMQYDQITVYDAEVAFSGAIDGSDTDSLASGCDLVEMATPVSTSSMDVCTDGGEKSVVFVAMDGENASNYVDLHDGDEKITYPEEGYAVINDALASRLGISTGDTISLRDSDGNGYQVTISGIFDNYIYNYVFVSPETLTDSGLNAEQKTAFVNYTDGADAHTAAAEIGNWTDVTSVSSTYDIRTRVDNMMSSMKYIVILVTVFAGALAFIVIFNLTNININERMREIATVKVLGFYPMETELYVFRENMFMTAIGSLAGLALGVGLHAFVMSQIQINMVNFPITIAPLSYLYSIALTFVFAFIVAFFMYYRLKRIPMAESMKSTE